MTWNAEGSGNNIDRNFLLFYLEFRCIRSAEGSGPVIKSAGEPFERNRCSSSAEITVHLPPKQVFTFVRNGCSPCPEIRTAKKRRNSVIVTPRESLKLILFIFPIYTLD